MRRAARGAARTCHVDGAATAAREAEGAREAAAVAASGGAGGLLLRRWRLTTSKRARKKGRVREHAVVEEQSKSP